MSGGAKLTTGWSTRRKTLLLVGDMRGAVVVASALFLRKFLLALWKFSFVACHGANKSPRGVFGTSQRVLICFFDGGGFTSIVNMLNYHLFHPHYPLMHIMVQPALEKE